MAPRSGIRLDPPTLAALTAGMCVGYLFASILPEVVASLREDLGLSATQSGAVATTTLLAIAVSGLLVSRRVTRGGRARIAIIGASLAALGYLICGVSDAWAALLLGGLIAGVGSGLALAASTSAIAATSDPDRASGTGILVNTFFGALLLAALPMYSGGRHAPVMLTMAAIMLIALPLLRRLPDANVTSAHTDSQRTRLGATLMVGALVFKLAETGLWAFTDDLGVNVVGLSQNTVGVVLAAAAVAGLLGVGLQVFLGDRYGRFWPVLILLVVDVVSRAVLLGSASPVVFLVANLVWLAAFLALMAYILAMGAVVERSGRWAALVAAAMAFGDAAGPLVCGFILDHGGYRQLLVMSLVLGVATMGCVATVARVIDRDDDSPVTPRAPGKH
jgi:MFS family permease